MADKRDYYEVLGVDKNADESTIKKAYYKGKKLAKRSSLFALTKKELFKLKSSSLYILNSSLGLVFEIIIAVLAVVKRDRRA